MLLSLRYDDDKEESVNENVNEDAKKVDDILAQIDSYEAIHNKHIVVLVAKIAATSSDEIPQKSPLTVL